MTNSILREARFRGLIEAMPNGVVMLNAGGGIELVNTATEQIFGYPRAALLGRPVEMLMADGSGEGRTAGRHDFTATGATRQMGGGILIGRRNDGAEIELEISLTPLDADDGTMVLAVFVDISHRLRLEAQLRHAQKMEVLGRLAAGVSHDFNNILQVILGGADLLKDEASISPVGHTFVEMVEMAARRGAYLTHHLLSYARQQTHSRKVIDLHDMVDKVRVVLSRTLRSNIAVHMQVAATAGQVRTDSGQLETALMNLAINAAYAMPDGGSLSIDVSSAEATDATCFGELKAGPYVMIAVTDTGTGMTPEVKERAFDPFFTTKGLEGTGLGLAMVQGFCRQAGGDVRVESQPGAGTRFELWLPEDLVAAMPVGQPKSIGKGRGLRLLLTDDNRDVLVMVEAFLRKDGFIVETASGGGAALALLASGQRFDVLVTDYMMAGMNGVDLIRRARCHQPGLPALIISGYAEVTEFMTDLPKAALLLKPFQRDDLTAQLRELVGDQGQAERADADAGAERSR